MKKTMKIFLALSILCTGIFAGDQSNGGLYCNPDDPTQCCDPADPTQECGEGFAYGGAGFEAVFGQVARAVIGEFIETVSPYDR